MSTASGQSPPSTLVAWQTAVKQRSERALDACAVLYKYELQQQLSHPGTGRLYRRRKVRYGKVQQDGKRLFAKRLKDRASDFHQASAPDESPAQDTGTLKRSAYVERVSRFVRAVGVSAAYAVALEFGSGRRRIAPRPFMRPSMARCKALLQHKFREVMTQGVGAIQ